MDTGSTVLPHPHRVLADKFYRSEQNLRICVSGIARDPGRVLTRRFFAPVNLFAIT